jgi:3-oxoacyl-[acyl-carrier protein] reductase
MFQISKYLLPYFKRTKNGHILAISSIYGVVSRKGRSAYSMSKHALTGLVQTMALEFALYNVKVNALAPGFVETEMTKKNNTKEIIDGFIEKIPLGKLSLPEDIANAAYYLCSPQNTYITGQNIIADGGILAGGFENK